MKKLFWLLILLVLGAGFNVNQGDVLAAAYPYKPLETFGGQARFMPVIGFMQSHKIEQGETLLDIARNYGLGFNEISRPHPELDPWVPKEGLEIDIPTTWILPYSRHGEIVINLPEMRLYRFYKDIDMVRTYPVGIGRDGFQTPPGDARVRERVEAPSWTMPPSARDGFGREVVPPGPDNPLGGYWIGLSRDSLGIHGTNFPWGVGRKVSRGCIRMYPKHIQQFFYEVEVGAKVEIIYEPVKLGLRGGDVFLEVHPDVYDRIPDMYSHVWNLLQSSGLGPWVDLSEVGRVVEKKKGVPAVVTNGDIPGCILDDNWGLMFLQPCKKKEVGYAQKVFDPVALRGFFGWSDLYGRLRNQESAGRGEDKGRAGQDQVG